MAKHLDLHLIADNYCTPKTKEVQTWLAKHPRFKMHFIPASPFLPGPGGAATTLARQLVAERFTTRSGRPIDKGFLYKTLNNRIYIGLAVHKGTAYPGEHKPIIALDLWNRVHGILQESPRNIGPKYPGGHPCSPQGPDLRAVGPCHDPHPHAAPGQALPLLCHHQRVETRSGDLPDTPGSCHRDRSSSNLAGPRHAAYTRSDRPYLGGGIGIRRVHLRGGSPRSADPV